MSNKFNLNVAKLNIEEIKKLMQESFDSEYEYALEIGEEEPRKNVNNLSPEMLFVEYREFLNGCNPDMTGCDTFCEMLDILCEKGSYDGKNIKQQNINYLLESIEAVFKYPVIWDKEQEKFLIKF
jgi:hypothetical protein